MLSLSTALHPVKDSNIEAIGNEQLEVPDYGGNLNVYLRSKRKRSFDSDEFMDEMRQQFANFASQQNISLANLQVTVEEIKKQNDAITTLCYYCRTSMMTLRKEQLTYIKILENKIENIERARCSAKLEVRNIPKLQNETKTVLSKVIREIGRTLSLEVQMAVVKDIYRGISKPGSTQPVIVELNSTTLKDSFLKSLKEYNMKNDKTKLNTAHLQIFGPSNTIYINESLTNRAKRLYYLAREYAKSNEYAFCWSSYVKIYLRKKEG
ncbi:unnamed protein product [Arctia plantaginis]|uniref:Uncharacterized protein n=1 Tax=Arctia plantaginis TaxID=874455 RepID=A0A8S0YUX5_ARCPL|nr:unnamed protein product [Arctia plantaginis]